MTDLLQIRNLTLGYDAPAVVSDVDMTVSSGTIVALLGSNGAGKSTILRGVSGLLRARLGSIRFDSVELTKIPGHKIAMMGLRQVPEGRQIFEKMTVAENLALGAFGMSWANEAKCRERVLKRFPKLWQRLDQRAGLMSGGEQQMLAIGRALMSDPRLLLLDEPSMGLSPLMVGEIFKVIEELKQEGRTILLVEQNAKEALKIADYAYVLEAGKIVMHGSAQDVMSNPRTAAAYLGGG